jgi:hypothetical protein
LTQNCAVIGEPALSKRFASLATRGVKSFVASKLERRSSINVADSYEARPVKPDGGSGYPSDLSAACRSATATPLCSVDPPSCLQPFVKLDHQSAVLSDCAFR